MEGPLDAMVPDGRGGEPKWVPSFAVVAAGEMHVYSGWEVPDERSVRSLAGLIVGYCVCAVCVCANGSVAARLVKLNAAHGVLPPPHPLFDSQPHPPPPRPALQCVAEAYPLPSRL